jgi:farnesol dehydrogenase
VSGLKNVVEAVKAHPSVKKLIFTSSFFALGPTDGYVADETQVLKILLFPLDSSTDDA